MVGFSQDGTFIVSFSDDKTIRIWDAWTGQEIPKGDIGTAVTWGGEEDMEFKGHTS